MRVYLVQHGEAESKDVDPERRLTQKGGEKVKRVAAALGPLERTVQTIWHSGKARARETAEILSPALRVETILRRDGLSPNDPVAPVRQSIEEASADLMIVGHLPFLGRLAAVLVTGQENLELVAFRFGCVLCLEKQDHGAWRIAWMLTSDLAAT